MRFPFQLSSDKPFDAAGFGTNAVDFLVVVPEYPQFDTKIRLTKYLQAAGGVTASAMVGLQRLGMKTVYAGRYGDDSAGDFGLKTLREENINTDFCEIIKGATTQIAFILIDERTGERTVIWDRSESLGYKPEEAPLAAANLAKVLHTDAHDPQACAQMSRAAKESGAIVSVDADNVYPGLEELLPSVDVLISSSEFPHRLTGIADEKTALAEIRNRYGCQVVGKTKGVEGCLILAENQFFTSPAYAVPGGCRDTTGAGDAFHAGFIYGLLADEEIETSLKIANAVAALKCRALGARTALPNQAELAGFLAK